jgi:hypothetical protein
MKKLVFIFILFFATSVFSFSQRKTFKIEDSGITPTYRNYNDGNIVITQDTRLLELVNKHKSKNKDRFIGWRVQIYFNSGQAAMHGAQNAKKKFLTRYGNKHGAYTVYDSPFYKIRVGDFRTKAEAMHFKDKIKSTFPNSWIIGDILVNYPID